MTTEFAGEPVVDADISEFRVGAWTATIEVDADDLDDVPITGTNTLEFEGIDFVCTVIEGEIQESGSRWKGFVIGGRDGLRGTLEGVHYVAPTVSTLLADIASATGEELSADILPSILGKRFPRWSRLEGPAHTAIRAIADRLQVDWRILRDGTLWLGTAAWTPVETIQDIVPEDADPQDYRVTVSYAAADDGDALSLGAAGEDDANESPDALPGYTFEDRRIQETRTYLTGEDMRQDLFFDPDFQTEEDRSRAQIEPIIRYARQWAGKVGGQAADGSLVVDLEDSVIGGRWGNMDRVPAVFGIPGVSIVATKGGRLRVWFDNGDPSLARCGMYDAEAPVSELNLAVQDKLRLGGKTAAEAFVLGTTHAGELSTLADAMNTAIAGTLASAGVKAAFLAAVTAFKLHLTTTALSSKVLGE